MKKNFSKICWSLLAVAVLGQGQLAFAQDRSTTTEVPVSSTIVSTVPTTVESASTTSNGEVTSTYTEITDPSTNLEKPVVTSSNETVQTQNEALTKVNAIIDTVSLPDGRLVLKVRLDHMVYDTKYINYQLIHNQTGKIIDSGDFNFTDVDGSVLKNRTYWGNDSYKNVATKAFDANTFKEDPDGTYTYKVFGSVNSTYDHIFGQVNNSKTISLKNRTHTTSAFTKVGGNLNVVRQHDGGLLLDVRLDHLIHSSGSGINYQIIHKKTGKIVDDGPLYFNETDGSVLKSRAYWGDDYYYGNVATRDVWNHAFDKDPYGVYTLIITGPTVSIANNFSRIFGIVNFSKTLDFSSYNPNRKTTTKTTTKRNTKVVSKPTTKVKPKTTTKATTKRTTKATTRPAVKTEAVYRLYHAGIKRHLYTKNYNEATVLRGRGWTFEGEKFRTVSQGTKPVYRLYHSGTREHLYTTSSNERDVLRTRGWRYEGISWYSTGTKPIYRLYHSGLKVHLYTADANEKNTLSKRGWNYEGISFYVQ